MNRHTWPVLLVLAAACAPGGASSPPRPETVRIQDAEGTTIGELSRSESQWAAAATVPQALDLVWEAVAAAYDSVGLKVTQLDPATRTMGNPALRLRRQLGRTMLHEYIDCGRTQGDLSADSYDIQLSVLTSLQPVPTGGTRVLTTVDAMARPMGISGNWVHCSSEGRLEARLAQIVRAKLQADS